MFLPFSGDGKTWEPLATGLRRLAGLQPSERLDPWTLAPRIGLRVIEADPETLRSLGDHGAHLLSKGSRCWSGGVYPLPFADGSRLCILNPTHTRRRNKITLMEEISHIHLRHRPSELIISGDGVEVRDYDHVQEREAFGVGAAALLPWETFFRSVNRGYTLDDLAEEFDVTPELARYRINICGAFRLFQARQRSKISSS